MRRVPRTLPRTGPVLAATLTLSLLGATAAIASGAVTTAGPRPDGTAVTPLGHRITPAGRQSRLGDLPLGSALSPDGRTLLVSNDGQGTQSLQVVDARSGAVRQTLPYSAPASLFVGVAFSPDGRTAWASGGGDGTIHRYGVAAGHVTESAPLTVGARLFPAGLAVTPDGRRLVVADHLGDAVSVVDVATGAVRTTAVGHHPRSVTLSRDGRTAWVTDQGGDTVSVVDVTGAPVVRSTVRVGTHPAAAVLDGSSVWVANAESDTLSVLDAATDRVVDTVRLAPYPAAPVGSSPSALALQGHRLYVAEAGNDSVDVVDTATRRVVGSVPTGWYPTAVQATEDRLLVASAKGLGAGPNDGPGQPDPTATAPTDPSRYVGSMIPGTLSAVALPLSDRQLAQGARQVADNNAFRRAHRDDRGASPIKHVIYVVQENRTFDQVFGDLGKGNGDAGLTLFGDESAPNQRVLQKQYTTFDNFYADAEVSAQGWNWAVASGSPLYTESLWPSNYSDRGAPYPSEEDDPATAPNHDPKDAYIWDRLADKGISFRNYGFYVNPDARGRSVATDPRLDARTDHAYTGFDLACPDNADTFRARKATCGTPRYDAWKSEFDGYVSRGDLPTVELLRLPNDHTAGTRPGSPTPRAYVADNDLALGRVVDAVSHSRYWKDTAIFVTEDDAQDGPDHVDAHRTLAQVISPYTRTGAVDSSLYSTASMLRTIEDLVGIDPLTQFDALSLPMTRVFGDRADLTPYRAVRPAEAGDATNAADAPLAAQSARMPLGKEDQADPRLLNEAVWQSVKGRGVPMP
ncbi:MAG: bifunctional YncE family protein/alkaline phosphatase family protein [Mycobacteriales bacterium]